MKQENKLFNGFFRIKVAKSFLKKTKKMICQNLKIESNVIFTYIFFRCFFCGKMKKKLIIFFAMEKKTNRINNIEEYFLDCACFSHNHSQVDNQKEEKKNKQTTPSLYIVLCVLILIEISMTLFFTLI